jgi:hypothetical protein
MDKKHKNQLILLSAKIKIKKSNNNILFVLSNEKIFMDTGNQAAKAPTLSKLLTK